VNEMAALEDRYREKSATYYDQVNPALLNLVTGRGLRVLDVGCGTGANGRQLLETGVAAWCAGVEIMADSAAIAQQYLDEVRVGMVDKIDLPWEAQSLDCILLGDVIEHVLDPWNLLERLKSLLKPRGIFVASVPNVQHLSVISRLVLFGDWRYHHDGILDITHVRFFTRRSLVRLFRQSGCMIDAMRPYFSGRRYSYTSRLSFGVLDDWLAERWLLRAQLGAA